MQGENIVTGIKRNPSIDFIKGVCIIIVVLCHSISFELLPNFINQSFSAIFLRCFFCVSDLVFILQ